MFSDAFSEGQKKDISGGFPSGSDPYTEHYDYPSDSDLEDGSSCSEEEYVEFAESSVPLSPRDSDSQVPSTVPPDHPPQPSAYADEVKNDDRLALRISFGLSNIPG